LDSQTAFELPNKETQVWVETSLGSCEYVSRFAHIHASSQLWRLRNGNGFFWLKLHKQAGKWASEIHALAQWAPGLGVSPNVVAFRAEPPALLVTEVPGTMSTTLALTPEAESRLWYEAGLYQARLHRIKNDWFGATNIDGSPQGSQAYDPVAFVRNNIEVRLRQGTDRGHWSPEERDFISRAMDTWCAALANEKPTAIHRDYGPRNWMADDSGAFVGPIDWEHARWDVRAGDMNRHWDDVFVTKPWLAKPFFEGYGGLDEDLRVQIQALRLLGATGGFVWAIEVGDTAYAELNRTALHRLMSEGSTP